MIEDKIIQRVYRQIFDEEYPILSIGFKDIDYTLKNTEASSLITVASKPAMGKSSFMTTVLLNLLKQGKRCMYFSLNLSSAQIARRLVGQIAEVNIKAINKTTYNLEKITDAINKLKEYDLTIFDNCLKIDNISKKVETYKPDIVFIDYLQMIIAPKNNYEPLESIMMDLKYLANENNCFIIIDSLLAKDNAAANNNSPQLSDFENKAIANLSDVVLFINRHEKKYADIIVAKNKYGMSGTFKLGFDVSTGEFFDIASNNV